MRSRYQPVTLLMHLCLVMLAMIMSSCSGSAVVPVSPTPEEYSLDNELPADHTFADVSNDILIPPPEPVLIEIQPIAELSPQDVNAYDLFGSSVSTGANGAVLVVGAPGSDIDNIANAGAAYVMFRVVDVWWVETRLQDANPTSGAGFGGIVHISSDGNTIVTGERTEAGTPDSSSVVTVFERFGEGWQLTAQLSVAETEQRAALSAYDRSIAISGDGNSIMVGAAGTIWVYQRISSQWRLVQQLTSAANPLSVGFGSQIVCSDDGERLFIADNVYGVIEQFTWTNDQYTTDTSNAETNATIVNSGPATGNRVITVNAEGNTLVAASVFQSDAKSTGSTQHHASVQMEIFKEKNDGNWDRVQQLTIKGSYSDAAQLAIDSSALADTITLAISDPHSANRSVSTFAKHNGDKSTPAWVLQSILINPNNSDNGFAQSVAISAEGAQIVVGAPTQSNDIGDVSSGRVWIY